MMRRREFLAAAALAPAAGGLAVIDTHAHIYSLDEKRYPTIAKPLRPPGDSGTVARLRQMMRENGVAAACLVQVSTFYRWDNRFILDTAAANRDWAAGICTPDPDNPQSGSMLREWVRTSGIRGIRSIPGNDRRFDSDGVRALWRTCGELGLTVNALGGRHDANALARMIEAHPKQPVVLDHCLNLKAGSEFDATMRQLLRLAQFPNVHAKLTFLATGSAEPYPFRDMHEPCKRLIAAFTPQRCIWGSDFPNPLWTPKATYGQCLQVFTREMALPADVQAAILRDTAQRLYFRS